MKRRSFSWPWFLLGLGSQLQILFSLSISELFVFIAGPYYMLTEWGRLRHDGFSTFAKVGALLVLGCGLGCLVNRTPMFGTVRGMATTVLLFLSIFVVHHFLRKDMNGLKWYFLGGALSLVLCTFVFKKFAEAGVAAADGFGNATTEEIMAGPIFWIQRLGAFAFLPISGWYLSTPLIYMMLMPLGMATFAMATSASGRSSALTSAATSLIILVGGKKRHKMRRMSRYFFIGIVLTLALAKGASSLYRYAAQNGWLSEEARMKYEIQTRGGHGVVSLLIGGRAASFVGVLAALDHPIFGLGPWAVDTEGYYGRFLAKFGSAEDYDEYEKAQERALRLGAPTGLVSCHAVWVEFWVWYGLGGLVFCLYVLFVYVRYIRKDVGVIPQWYGLLAANMPGMLWTMFFSPLTGRIGWIVLVSCCLMARAVRLGKVNLPVGMQIEILKAEK